MSLTSFIRDNADVRERFQQEFKKPVLFTKQEMLAPPMTTNYSTVGTAFDYLLRFFLQYLNPHTIDKGYWVAEEAIELLIDDAKLYTKGKKIISNARNNLATFLKKGQISDELIESALLLATLDPIFRAGLGYEAIGIVHKDDIQDLRNLISIVDNKLFTAKNLCMVNPTFGSASALVGGADADLVIDDTIIDIKTTKKLTLDRSAFNQIIGYYVLHYISGVGELNPKPMITKIAIYYSRYGYLYIISLSDIIDSVSFPKFVQWFHKRADELFA